ATATGECLRLLPGRGQDSRRVLSGFSVTVERGCALPLYFADRQMAGTGDCGCAGHPDLRAHAPSLSLPAGLAQPCRDDSGRDMVRARGLDCLESAAGERIARRGRHPATGLSLAFLSGFLSGRVVDDQRGLLEEPALRHAATCPLVEPRCAESIVPGLGN